MLAPTFFAQCVLGTVIDSYYRGYDVILVEDATATTSPEGGFENVVYNVGNVRSFFSVIDTRCKILDVLNFELKFVQSYGFATDTKRIAEAALQWQ